MKDWMKVLIKKSLFLISTKKLNYTDNFFIWIKKKNAKKKKGREIL